MELEKQSHSGLHSATLPLSIDWFSFSYLKGSEFKKISQKNIVEMRAAYLL